MDAVMAGKRDAWIRNFFSADYPAGLDHAAIVFDIVHRKMELTGTMYQYINCGRIMIQVGDRNEYASYKPEDSSGTDIFRRAG